MCTDCSRMHGAVANDFIVVDGEYFTALTAQECTMWIDCSRMHGALDNDFMALDDPWFGEFLQP